MYIYIMYKRTNKKHGNHPPTRLTTHSPADPPTHPATHPTTHPWPMATVFTTPISRRDSDCE